MPSKPGKGQKRRPYAKPLSLHPLTPDQVLHAMLIVPRKRVAAIKRTQAYIYKKWQIAAKNLKKSK
jgi:hypothetical protein